MKKKSNWIDLLVQLDACDEAITWARNYRTLQDAWHALRRADWLVWFVCELSDRRGDYHLHLSLEFSKLAPELRGRRDYYNVEYVLGHPVNWMDAAPASKYNKMMKISAKRAAWVKTAFPAPSVSDLRAALRKSTPPPWMPA